jgi:hypothetical protein
MNHLMITNGSGLAMHLEHWMGVKCVPVADQGRYRNKKHHISTNMLGVVDWNMKFLYVLPSWEGSACDGRVLRDAMSHQDGFVVPKGTTLCLGILFLLFAS